LVTLYADTSALAKLIRPEVESQALAAFLDGGNSWGQVPELISSDLTTVELHRAARREGSISPADVDEVLDKVYSLRVRPEIISLASEVKPVPLRSLDALHLASALRSNCDMIAYDQRLIQAARGAGLTVYSPGMTTSQ
jgi:predicted nucleic acid-binding protein